PGTSTSQRSWVMYASMSDSMASKTKRMPPRLEILGDADHNVPLAKGRGTCQACQSGRSTGGAGHLPWTGSRFRCLGHRPDDSKCDWTGSYRLSRLIPWPPEPRSRKTAPSRVNRLIHGPIRPENLDFGP